MKKTPLLPRPWVAVGLGRRGPFDVQLAIAEGLLGVDLAGLADVDAAVFDAVRLAAVPLREVLAVEQHDGVGRRPARPRRPASTIGGCGRSRSCTRHGEFGKRRVGVAGRSAAKSCRPRKTGSRPAGGCCERRQWKSGSAWDGSPWVGMIGTCAAGRRGHYRQILKDARPAWSPLAGHPLAGRERAGTMSGTMSTMVVVGVRAAGSPRSYSGEGQGVRGSSAPSRISYKPRAAVDRAPNFAPRWVSNFPCFASGPPPLAAGSLDGPTRGISRNPYLGRLAGTQDCFIFFAKVFQSSFVTIRVCSEIPLMAMHRLI